MKDQFPNVWRKGQSLLQRGTGTVMANSGMLAHPLWRGPRFLEWLEVKMFPLFGVIYFHKSKEERMTQHRIKMHELRIYPAKFASKLVKLIPKMKRSPPKIHVEVTQKRTISQHTTNCCFHVCLLCAHHNPGPSQLLLCPRWTRRPHLQSSLQLHLLVIARKRRWVIHWIIWKGLSIWHCHLNGAKWCKLN